MRLSTRVQFTLKDLPQKYRGLTGEHWNFGKEKEIGFDQLIRDFAETVISYFTIFTDAETMNAACQRLSRWFDTLHFSSSQEESTHDRQA